MGNCQATNVADLVLKHPNGRTERMYWSVTAGDVMQMNPGHYVSLIIPLSPSSSSSSSTTSSADDDKDDQSVLSFTQSKLLRPHEYLLLGRAYRLVTTQEVMTVIRAKKHGRMKRSRSVSIGRSQPDMDQEDSNNGIEEEQENSQLDSNYQGMQQGENHTQRQRSKFAASRSKSWRPSLNSISEAGI